MPIADSMLHFLEAHWVLLGAALVALRAGYKLFHNQDFADHAPELKRGLVLVGATFLIGWSIGQFSGSPLAGVVAGVFLMVPAVIHIVKICDRALNDTLGGVLFDMLFSEGPFAETFRRVRKRPNLALLHHWRASGHVRKASRAARHALANDGQSFGHWLFAIETAVVYEKSPRKGRRLASRLIQLSEISDDQKLYATKQVESWSTSMGETISLNLPAGQVRHKPFEEATALREQGFFAEAGKRLQRILRRDPENFAAMHLLIRLYAQDLKRPALAERTFQTLKNTPYVPASLVSFVENSLPEWTALPPCATRRRNYFWTRLSLNPPRQPAPRFEPDLSPAAPERLSVAELFQAGYVGSALLQAQTKAEADPDDFNLQRQLLDAHCRGFSSLKNAEKVMLRIEENPQFTEAQKQEARTLVANAKTAEHELIRRLF